MIKRAMLAISLMTVLCATSRADDAEEAREHYRKGTKSYELGQFDDAIREYRAAYHLRDEPELLYDIAQAQRQAGQRAEALRSYRMYLAKNPRAKNRAEVEARIEDLRRQVEAPPGSKPTEPVPLPNPPAHISNAIVQPVESVAPPVTTAPRPSGKPILIGGIVTTAVGGALTLGGIVALVLAKQASDAISSANQQHGVFDSSKESAGKRDDIAGGVCLGVGIAALVAGSTMIALGVHRSHVAVAVSSTRASLRVNF